MMSEVGGASISQGNGLVDRYIRVYIVVQDGYCSYHRQLQCLGLSGGLSALGVMPGSSSGASVDSSVFVLYTY